MDCGREFRESLFLDHMDCRKVYLEKYPAIRNGDDAHQTISMLSYVHLCTISFIYVSKQKKTNQKLDEQSRNES